MWQKWKDNEIQKAHRPEQIIFEISDVKDFSQEVTLENEDNATKVINDLPKYDEKMAKNLKYQQWEITENVGKSQSNDMDLLRERDQLLIENRYLIEKIKTLEEVMDNNDLDKLEEKDQLEVLNQKIIELSQCIVDTKLELEQQKTHAEINYQALEKQLAEQQKSTKKLISKGFFSRLFYVVKGGR